MEPLAPHEKVFVDSSLAEDEYHGQLGCHECHGGDPNDPDWKTAHDGVVKDPSYPDPSETCGACHDLVAMDYQSSLHVTLGPYKKMIYKRAKDDKAVRAKLDKAMDRHCTECHSSCGQCHISRPDSVGGGLLEGHLVQKKPPMQEVCTACHGSRIEKEYFGKNKDLPADVHKKKYFRCTKCHTGDEMHGDGKEYDNRYQVETRPRCSNCHKKIYEPGSKNARNHWIHKGQVSCQVCHSVPYKNCYSCHVGTDKKGLPFYKTEGSSIDFKIGLNPLRSEDRPERFVTVRHVPVDHETFEFYVEDALTDFDKLPTWKLATPHNIQRKTPQNKTCNSCHGNSDLFLRKDDVKKEYLDANEDVIVSDKEIPPKRREK